MTLSDYAAIYLTVSYAMMFWCVWAELTSKEAMLTALFWPLALTVLAIAAFCRWVFPGWSIDVQDRMDTLSKWGTRKPGDKPGIALRCPWFEIQFWKNIK